MEALAKLPDVQARLLAVDRQALVGSLAAISATIDRVTEPVNEAGRAA